MKELFNKAHTLVEALPYIKDFHGKTIVVKYGGSIGSGTMEVCCFVVDFELAKTVIEADLKDTEFADFTRIYDEEAED